LIAAQSVGEEVDEAAGFAPTPLDAAYASSGGKSPVYLVNCSAACADTYLDWMRFCSMIELRLAFRPFRAQRSPLQFDRVSG